MILRKTTGVRQSMVKAARPGVVQFPGLSYIAVIGTAEPVDSCHHDKDELVDQSL